MSDSARGKEDSGLINLDALMGAAASEPAIAATAAVAPPAAAAVVPPSVAPSPPPAVASHRPLAAPAMPSRPPRPLPTPPPPQASVAPLSAPIPPTRASVAPPSAAALPPQASVAPLSAPAPAARRVDDSLEGIASAPAALTASVAPAVPALAAASATAPAPREKRRLVPILLGLAALAGIAAVALHPWRSPATTTPIVAAKATATGTSTAPVTAIAKPSEPTGMDPNALPAADVAASASVAPTATAAPAPTVAAAPVAKPEATAQITQKDLGTMPTGDQGDLAGAMKSAVGPKDAPTETTKTSDNSGANQIRPAAGQVVGAIGAVLPAARACLGPDDSIRSGSLVFSSDGSVKQVSLSGGTKPTDDCIKSALSKAKLQPFAEDSFTTRVTVRP